MSSFFQIYPQYEEIYNQSLIIKEPEFNNELIEKINKYNHENPNKYIILRCDINTEYIKNTDLLPESVTHLILLGQFNIKFNYDLTIFPSQLKCLEIILLYDGTLDYLPQSLEYLRLCMWYPNQKLDNLPCNLKKLYIENYFTTDFNPLFTTLPKSIEYLELMEIQNITWSYLPPNLKSITLDKQFIIEFHRSPSSNIEQITLKNGIKKGENVLTISDLVVNYQVFTTSDKTALELNDKTIEIYLNIDDYYKLR